MTVDEMIALVNNLEPNQYKREQKISWLADLDEIIFNEIFRTHEVDETFPTTYTRHSTGNEQLLVSGSYGNDMYQHYLMNKMAVENFELDKANVETALFNYAYENYANQINRNFLPVAKGKLRI